jgi:xylitol oxidase
VWVKQREHESELPEHFFGGTSVIEDRHPIRRFSAEGCTPQRRAGRWLDRLPHFQMEFTPSTGAEIQSEYLVPSTFGADAIRALRSLGNEIAGVVQVSEIRAVAADDLWMSPSFGTDVVAFHFTWRPDAEAVRELTPKLEAALEPFGSRPHWGKVHAFRGERLAKLYPRYDDFERIVLDHDPRGKFHNDALERWFPKLARRG